MANDDPISEVGTLENIHGGREVFYNFLSRSYQSEVDSDYLQMLISLSPYFRQIAKETEVDKLKLGSKSLDEFVTHLRGLTLEMQETLLLDLARDFAYLFLTGPKSVPMCESIYLSPDHLLMQEPYTQVLLDYETIGFRASDDLKEPEDHLATQFKFMAVLSQRIRLTIAAGDADNAARLVNFQKTYLENHLAKWVPSFCYLLNKAAEGRVFYQTIGYLTEGFLDMDYKFINDDLL